MENVTTHGRSHPGSTSSRTVTAQFARYTAQQIADEHGVKEVTIRTRWFNWLAQVAPEPLLKDKDGFTELARSLFSDFAQRVKTEGMKSKDWVFDAKSRYSQEWASAGVIEGELLPPEVGGALATLQNKAGSLQQKGLQLMERLHRLNEQAAVTSTDFSQGEINLYRARGAVRGMERFEVEVTAELETYNQLRQQFLEAGS
ncbi:hypothetical protein NDA01_30870 [Trichocoleus desertorum AS-A10]|uniref:hypothetical protein n=1 Tax=Trichocoleus desertorum TaxID=1481672 RepID=UPI003299AF69